MKIKPYVEKLENSQEYKDFKGKYPQSFMVAGFFVLDFEQGNNVHQIDFYVPEEKKIAAFTLDDQKVQVQLLDMMNQKIPEELSLDTNIDLDALKGILADEMHNRGMSESIKKIIAVIQNLEGKKLWNLNCVLSGMEILKSHVEDDSQTVLKIEKKSLMDIMQTVSPKQLAEMKKPKEETKDDVKTELKNLDRLEKEIEKERSRLQEEMKKKEKPSN